MLTIKLKPGRERSAKIRHPWVFQSALAGGFKGGTPGETVRVEDSSGQFLAYGMWNPRSKIALRLMEWREERQIDDGWWREKITEALARRKHLAERDDCDVYRLVFSEADLLPGLIVDRYGNYAVTQFLTAGANKRRDGIVSVLREELKLKGIYEKADPELMEMEGLKGQSGKVWGEEPLPDLTVRENGYRYYANITGGQKTGFYADQRDNRRAVAEFAGGKRVLDGFCYTGGFTIPCLAAGARSVTAADSSKEALAGLERNLQLNPVDKGRVKTVEANLFQLLRDMARRGEKYDLVILDPPKLAPTKATLTKALRAYKDLNLHALRLLEPGGILATFSCSGGVPASEFQTVVGWAATDAGCDVQVVRRLTQGEDHPVRVSYPESEYLKGLICRKL